MMFSRLEQQFSKVIARDAVSVLKQSIRSGGTVLAVGGNQLTGKSTLAERLAHRFGGKSVSCGSTFRQEAARRNVSVAELSKMALNDPSIDATIEYNVAMQIAAGSDDGGLLILEGRQPAVLVNYLRTLGKGRENTATLFLHCSVREQVLRFVKRDASASPILHFLRVNLPAIDYADMAEVTKTIKYLSRCEAFHFANIERMKHVKNIYAMLQGNSQRDEDDRRRYSLLYGEHPELDYQNEDIYDYVIDTTKNEAGETFEQACDLLSDVLKSKQAP